MRDGVAKPDAEDHGGEDEWREEAVAPAERPEELCRRGRRQRGRRWRQGMADAPMALMVPFLVGGGARGSQAGRSQVVDGAVEEVALAGDEGPALAALSLLR